MTHSSGIGVSEELHAAFGDAKTNGLVRAVVAKIVDEQLVAAETLPVTDTSEADAADLGRFFQPKQPTFVLWRLDDKNDVGWEWILLSYVPDGSPVKARMLYASSRDNLKKQLGYSSITYELHGTTPKELDWEAIYGQVHRNVAAEREAVLTRAEREVRAEATAHVEEGHTKTGVHSVQFPLAQDAAEQLQRFVAGDVNLVQFSLDLDAETVELANAGTEDVSALPSTVSADEPRFSLFQWEHEHDGEPHSTPIFVYSCPDSAPVKARMLYSTVKTTVIDYCVAAGVEVEHKLEISEGDEWTTELMQPVVHPPKVAARKVISRPSRPGRGGRRLVRRGK